MHREPERVRQQAGRKGMALDEDAALQGGGNRFPGIRSRQLRPIIHRTDVDPESPTHHVAGGVIPREPVAGCPHRRATPTIKAEAGEAVAIGMPDVMPNEPQLLIEQRGELEGSGSTQSH
jgi:hypothetical protein